MRILFTGILLVLISGCASSTGKYAYPSTWPELERTPTADGCPNLSGTYSNSGDDAFPHEPGELPSLIDIFRRMSQGPQAKDHKWDIPAEAKNVSIDQTPETLRVTFLGDEGPLSSLSFRRIHRGQFKFKDRYDDLYMCHVAKNGIRLFFLAEFDNYVETIPSLYAGGGSTVSILLRATDGSLVVQLRRQSIGLSLFVVGTGIRNDSKWIRYPQTRMNQRD
jgi:hypothetical protein